MADPAPPPATETATSARRAADRPPGGGPAGRARRLAPPPPPSPSPSPSPSAQAGAVAVTRVLVVDADPLVRHGLEGLLAAAGGFQVLGHARTGREARALTRRLQPQVVVLGAALPDMSGARATGDLAPAAGVLVVADTEDPATVLGVLRAGACGYLVRGRFDADELARAVRGVAAGETVLSPAVAPVVMAALRAPSACGGRAGSGMPADAG
ncbi:MAG: response regulator transcription factor, partial [Euzebyaceae bacterium]|nr:response regulator transcription factor [Euzebyaceae bacterium]